jgi:hypothetical protein
VDRLLKGEYAVVPLLKEEANRVVPKEISRTLGLLHVFELVLTTFLLAKQTDYSRHRFFQLSELISLDRLSFFLFKIINSFNYIKEISNFCFAVRQYALHDPRWTYSRFMNYEVLSYPLHYFLVGCFSPENLTEAGLIQLSYLKRALPIVDESVVKTFEEEHFKYFHDFPSHVDKRLANRAYNIALEYSSKVGFTSEKLISPYLSGACLEFPRSLGGSAGYMSFLIRYYRRIPPTDGPYFAEINSVCLDIDKAGIVEVSLLDILEYALSIQQLINQLVLFICLRECNPYIEHARSCKHGLCNDLILHPQVLSYAVPEHGKARGITINEACVASLAAYVRIIGTSILERQPEFKMAFKGIKSNFIDEITSLDLDGQFIHSGDQSKATDNFPFIITFSIWRGFIDGTLLSSKQKSLFKSIIYMCLGPQRLMPSPRLRSLEQQQIIDSVKLRRNYYARDPESILSDFENSTEGYLQEFFKTNFDLDFRLPFDCSSSIRTRFAFLAQMDARTTPSKTDLKRSYLVASDKSIITSWDSFWKNIVFQLRSSPVFPSLLKYLYTRLYNLCKNIYVSDLDYLTRHGVLMSSPLSFPTLNFYNILGRDISKVKLRQFFYGDDEISIGKTDAIFKFMNTMSNLNCKYNMDKDILCNDGGLFVEIPFQRVDNHLKVINVVKMKNIVPTDMDFYTCPGSFKEHAMSQSLSSDLQSRCTYEIYRHFDKEYNYLTKRGIPLDLISPLGGVGLNMTTRNENVHAILSYATGLFHLPYADLCSKLFELKRLTSRSSTFTERAEITTMVKGLISTLPGFYINHSGKGLPYMKTIEKLSNQIFGSQDFISGFHRTHEIKFDYKYYAKTVCGFYLNQKIKVDPHQPDELAKLYDLFRTQVSFTISDSTTQLLSDVISRRLSRSVTS